MSIPKKYRGKPCLHCGKKANRARCLCHVCYADLAIRDLYPVEAKMVGNKPLTEAEVEALVASAPPLPEWWEASGKASKQVVRGCCKPKAVRRGVLAPAKRSR